MNPHRQSRRRMIPGVVAGLLALMLLAPLAGTPHATAQESTSDVQTIRRFETDERAIVLTFDAGADRGYGAEILDTLRDRNVRASFGMTGVWAEGNPDLVRRIVDEGHHLMNHSWDHPSFPGLTIAQRVDQLRRTENLIREQVGIDLQPYFRPPYGEYDDATLTDLAGNGYTFNIMWTVDTLGWNGYSAEQITQRVLDGAAPGAIMLMHVGAASQDAAALPGMIDQLRARGYHFATADELAGGAANAERYFPETGHTASGAILRYWERYGGLFQFGYPLTDAHERDGVVTQYFERARLEWHPGTWLERFDVHLGLLGNELTAERRASGERPFQRVAGQSDADCTYFPETGHTLCFGFRDYWTQHGGLAIYGFPISEEFQERNPDTGVVYTVQYFERARFEWHPENRGTPYEVLLGRLGAQQLANREP